ncbi:MAG: hypothetical protein K6V73_00325 [Firmicutes bacterium]|nr:hypothetical protein [Bacillota bacterium]
MTTAIAAAGAAVSGSGAAARSAGAGNGLKAAAPAFALLLQDRMAARPQEQPEAAVPPRTAAAADAPRSAREPAQTAGGRPTPTRIRRRGRLLRRHAVGGGPSAPAPPPLAVPALAGGVPPAAHLRPPAGVSAGEGRQAPHLRPTAGVRAGEGRQAPHLPPVRQGAAAGANLRQEPAAPAPRAHRVASDTPLPERTAVRRALGQPRPAPAAGALDAVQGAAARGGGHGPAPEVAPGVRQPTLTTRPAYGDAAAPPATSAASSQPPAAEEPRRVAGPAGMGSAPGVGAPSPLPLRGTGGAAVLQARAGRPADPAGGAAGEGQGGAKPGVSPGADAVPAAAAAPGAAHQVATARAHAPAHPDPRAPRQAREGERAPAAAAWASRPGPQGGFATVPTRAAAAAAPSLPPAPPPSAAPARVELHLPAADGGVRATLVARGGRVEARLEAGAPTAARLAGAVHELVGALSQRGVDLTAQVVARPQATVTPDGGRGGQAGGGGDGREQRRRDEGRPGAFTLDTRV